MSLRVRVSRKRLSNNLIQAPETTVEPQFKALLCPTFHRLGRYSVFSDFTLTFLVSQILILCSNVIDFQVGFLPLCVLQFKPHIRWLHMVRSHFFFTTNVIPERAIGLLYGVRRMPSLVGATRTPTKTEAYCNRTVDIFNPRMRPST